MSAVVALNGELERTCGLPVISKKLCSKYGAPLVLSFLL
jgi:hypothetical protein